MNRRNFLRLTGAAAVSVALPLPRMSRALAATEPRWRVFEVTTTVDILRPAGVSRAWVALPLAVDTDFQKSLGNEWSAPGGKAWLAHDDHYGLSLVAAEWAAGAKPVLEVKSRFTTRDWSVDLAGKPGTQTLDPAARRLWTAPTKLIPTDGIVFATSHRILNGVKGGDIVRARALYDWVCDNSFRDPKTKGCGLGDIKFMLETKAMGGKCADINALFVGLARAAGIPARDVFGVRVADSQRGYQALGRAGDITKAQHCRAEFWADGVGWIPVDPGDVRKVILEEPPGNLPVDDPKVQAARGYLFGAWEMNWLAYNYAHDVVLPGSNHGPVGFLMYPQGETSEGRLDCLDPARFKYALTSRELSFS